MCACETKQRGGERGREKEMPWHLDFFAGSPKGEGGGVTRNGDKVVPDPKLKMNRISTSNCYTHTAHTLSPKRIR